MPIQVFSRLSVVREISYELPDECDVLADRAREMSDFDHAAAFAAQADPDVVVNRLLAPTRKRLRYRDWFNTRAIPLPGGPKRTADLVAVLDDPDAPGRPALLIQEFQSRHDPDKLDTTLVEVA